MDPTRHLCLVDADPARRRTLAHYLRQRGLAVTPLARAEPLLAWLQQRPARRPDLALLAAGLPGLDAPQACQRLRAGGERLPLILRTASDDEIERIVGLELGADDCLRPQDSARELLARVQALLRRCAAPAAAPVPPRPVAVGGWLFDPSTRCLRRGPQAWPLSAVEHALLAALTARPGQVVAREQLLAAWPARAGLPLARSVDAAVMRLRRRVEPEPAAPRSIRTVRGHGYVFVPGAA